MHTHLRRYVAEHPGKIAVYAYHTTHAREPTPPTTPVLECRYYGSDEHGYATSLAAGTSREDEWDSQYASSYLTTHEHWPPPAGAAQEAEHAQGAVSDATWDGAEVVADMRHPQDPGMRIHMHANAYDQEPQGVGGSGATTSLASNSSSGDAAASSQGG